MAALYFGLLSVAIWLVAAVLVVAGTLAILLAALLGGRCFIRGVRRLIIRLDEEEHARVCLQRLRQLQEYNQARDEVQELKSAVQEPAAPPEVTIVRMRTLRQKTEILQRRQQQLLDSLSEHKDGKD